MRLGVLTAGGDCPGLNAVIRAVVRKSERHYGSEVLGFIDGFKGLIEDNHRVLTVSNVRGILPRGGTILGTSRVHPWMADDSVDRIKDTIAKNEIDALIVIGGEGSLTCAKRLYEEAGINVVGVPKTIDNDIGGTALTFGFMTAVDIVTEAIDRLHTTAESHDRVMVVEVMGRHVGHIAAWAGIAGGASVTLVPEHPFDIAEVADALSRRHENGGFASIVVVAEGALPKPGTMDIPEPEVDVFGHQVLGGIGHHVAKEIQKRTGYDTRVTVLGHVQRGGTPSSFDRVLCSWFGVEAANAVHEGDFGIMTALDNHNMVRVPLADAVGDLKGVDPEFWEVAKTFFA